MRRRYGVVISAAVLALQLAGSGSAQIAPPDLEELEIISALLDANDVAGLRRYLALNPELLEGESELAQLLRDYMEQSENMAAFLGAGNAVEGSDSDEWVPVARSGADGPLASLY